MSKRIAKLKEFSSYWDLFDYDKDSGNLTWKIRASYNTHVGAIVGAVGKDKKANSAYRYCHINGVSQTTHRVIWEMHKGKIPKGMMIDHIDGNGLNNRIENLRCVSNRLNQCNQSKHRTGKIPGVAKNKFGLFAVKLASNGIVISLGAYKSEERAKLSHLLASSWLEIAQPIEWVISMIWSSNPPDSRRRISKYEGVAHV